MTFDALKCVRAAASTLRAIALIGAASAIFMAFFAVLADKLHAAMMISAFGAAWWVVCDGIAWVLRRKAEEIKRDADSRPRELPGRPSWR